MIYVKAVREAYNEEIIRENIWTRRKYNLADAMRNTQINNELINAFDNNQLHYGVENSVIKKNDKQQKTEKD